MSDLSPHFQRGFHLFSQGKYDNAIKELRMGLVENPEQSFPHALVSICLSHLNQNKEATEEAQKAIAFDPEESFAHFALSKAYTARNRYKEAEESIREAIRLSPGDSSYYSLLSSIRLQQQDWKGGLAAAEEGLEFDPENQVCNNLRAMALVKLGRNEEAGQTLEGALERDPDDSFSHANQGWALLHEGNAKQALVHFQEALRLDPNCEFARAGMIEALKAQYWIYRVILGYFLWMSKLSPQARWGVVLGLFFLQQILSSTAKNNPELQPYLDPLLDLYLVFVLSTWVAQPLSNLFLRFNRLGNLALTPEERIQSNWIGGLIFFALVAVVVGILSIPGYSLIAWFVALNLVLLVFPVCSYYSCSKGWPRWVMATFVLAMVSILVVGVSFSLTGVITYEGKGDQTALKLIMTGVYWLGKNPWLALISTFVGAALSGVQVKE